MAGLTTTGLQTLRYQEIFDNIKSRLLRDISPNLDVSEDSQLGLFLASIARSLADTHEILSEIYDGGTIDKAEGFNLDDITALNAVYRYVAQATRGQVEFTGTTGATISSTTRLRSTAGNIHFNSAGNTRFRCNNNYTIIGSATIKRSSIRPFKNGHVFNIFRVNSR